MSSSSHDSSLPVPVVVSREMKRKTSRSSNKGGAHRLRGRRARAATFLTILSSSIETTDAFVILSLKSSQQLPPLGVKEEEREIMSLSSVTIDPRQTLQFNDSKTGISVCIIGTMHYNPHSVAKVENIIQAYGSQLGSIVLEQCQERWELTQSTQPKGSIKRKILDNEFQAAAEIASFYNILSEGKTNIRVVLADENIRENNKRVNKALKSTIQDLCNPLKGWESIIMDLTRAYQENIDPTSVSQKQIHTGMYLDKFDLLDGNMLRYAPISLFRYIFGFVSKKPLQGSLLLTWLSALISYGVIHGIGDFSLEEEVKATAAGLLLNLILGVPLLGRVLLVALLGDRNKILAQNIRKECERLEEEGRNDHVCVVVLGLAHCNGVKHLLTAS